MSDTFVVIGGDAAGMGAASKAKRETPEMDVVVFERGEWVSYAACGMPYFVKGDVEALDDLVAVTPEEFREKRDVDLRTGHEVVGIDPDGQLVTVENSEGRFEQPFDPVSVAISAQTRAHYYPDRAELTVTLLADRGSGRLLGGTTVGREGVKRIDTIATALRAGMTVSEFRTADLAYAPRSARSGTRF